MANILLMLMIAATIGGLSENDVIFANDTGLPIARMEIDGRAYEMGPGGNGTILVSITPQKHHIKLLFRGGADVDWKHMNFSGVREVIFERIHNEIHARIVD